MNGMTESFTQNPNNTEPLLVPSLPLNVVPGRSHYIGSHVEPAQQHVPYLSRIGPLVARANIPPTHLSSKTKKADSKRRHSHTSQGSTPARTPVSEVPPFAVNAQQFKGTIKPDNPAVTPRTPGSATG